MMKLVGFRIYKVRLRLLKREDGIRNRFNNDGLVCNDEGGEGRSENSKSYISDQVVFLFRRQTLESGEWTD